MSGQNIALLVFARSAEEEVKHKPFLMKGALAKSLSRHTKRIATDSGLPILYFDETKQIGSDFGSRFSNALQNTYNQGYDSVIAIGNDCPHLEVNHINQAKKILENDGAVLGPTFDGGFYLIGISKKHFHYKTFLNYSWNTNTVFQEAYNSFLSIDCPCLTLQTLRDIDHFSELEKLSLYNICNEELRHIIIALTAKHIENYSIPYINNFSLLQAVPFNKGSPLPLPI